MSQTLASLEMMQGRWQLVKPRAFVENRLGQGGFLGDKDAHGTAIGLLTTLMEFPAITDIGCLFTNCVRKR